MKKRTEENIMVACEQTMDWVQILTIILTNAGLVIWFRAESRSDWRHMDTKLDASIKAIQAEMKDFHTKLALQDQEFKNRIAAIEERTRK